MRKGSSMGNRPGIVVMVKAPDAGNVKTRLTPPLPPEAAAELAACFVRDTVRAARRLVDAVMVAYAPDEGRAHLEALLGPDLYWTPQRGASLGARMHHAAVSATAAGLGPLVLLGADSPTFPPGAVTEAFARLHDHDLVLGPAADGGCWCLGLCRPLPGLFEGIAWSTATVCDDLQSSVTRRGLRIARVASWYDVDTAVDLARLGDDPLLSTRAPLTAAWLAEHRQTSA
jgi:rSAM/selenodomain-associated transferase 1